MAFVVSASAQTTQKDSLTSPDAVTVSIPASVVMIHKDKALVADRYNKRFFEVSSKGLEQGREYLFRLRYSKADREKNHCIGCSGIVPAKVLGFAVTTAQARQDQKQIYNLREGYDRSPRYH